MANLTDPEIRGLLEPANYAVISTLNDDGSISSSVVWVSLEGDELAVNSARGRKWPTNLDRDPHVTLMVYAPDNPYEYVEIRGTATGSRDDADDHINRLAKKYINQDEYPYRQPGEQRLKYTITPDVVRYLKQR
ncbi:MAG TPA: TIGR03618 family F420-dependent PPOX class oxidoreductase [Solirubrobacteraceae bacterium]